MSRACPTSRRTSSAPATGSRAPSVDEEQVREDGAAAELERVRALIEDVDARDVGGQQVGRELESRERAVERAGERLREHRLADAREVLDDQVPLGDEAEDDEPEHV